MKIALISTATALVACVSLGAQTPTPDSAVPTTPAPGASQIQTTPEPTPPSAVRAISSSDTINVTGCVEGSGTAFKLTKVADASKASGAMSKSESTTMPRADKDGPKDPEALLDEYALIADPSIDLSKHAGHTVAVTGTVAKTAVSSATKGSTASARSSDGLKDANLKITSLRMVSPSCQ